jgi:hypothetical protein
MTEEEALRVMQEVIDKNVELTVIPIPVATAIVAVYKKLERLEFRLCQLEIRLGGRGFTR